jgi:carboxymethylenebutenolidase
MADTIELTIGDITTTAYVAVPTGGGKHPGVVVAFHREGLDHFTAWVCDDLAANGYAAISPNHFHVMPPGVDLERRREFITDEQMGADLEAAANWLTTEGGADANRLALLGHCMGGRTTWMGLTSQPNRWKCGCIWYGGGSFNQLGNLPAPADRLEKINCPIAGFFGNDDQNPSPDDVNELSARLTKFGKEHEFHRYDDTGHAFMSFERPSYREESSKDSWAKALTFIGKHI